MCWLAPSIWGRSFLCWCARSSLMFGVHRFSSTQVHLRLDTSLEQDKLPVQAYMSRNLGLGEWGLTSAHLWSSDMHFLVLIINTEY